MSAVGIPAWEVEELPKTAKLGEIRVMQGKTYIYSGGEHWDKIYSIKSIYFLRSISMFSRVMVEIFKLFIKCSLI